jgi:RimJ/RimL family protein N-acetyltransferase
MSYLIEFETKRLRLRQWLPGDREPFAALNADPTVMAFFPCLLDRAASDAMADRCESIRWPQSICEGGSMETLLYLGGFVAIYLFLQIYLLPKMGVST